FCKDEYGANHLTTLGHMSDLAFTYQAVRNFDQALSLREEVFKLRKARHGPDHEYTLYSMNSLASTYLAAGRVADALPVLTDAVPRLRKKLGLQNHTTRECIGFLIACHERLNQPAQAEPLSRELADFWKRQAGPDAPSYANQLASLGLNLLRQRKPALAE